MVKALRDTRRTCLVTRVEQAPEDMIRFVLSPEGTVVPDLKGKLPGRGVWITAHRAHVETAVRRKQFGRGFGETALADADLPDLIDRLLVASALGALGLARKAGQVVTGFAKVETALKRGEAIGLVHASDASEDGVGKLQAVLRRHAGDENRISVVRSFTSAQLDLALGGMNVIHAAVLAGRAGEIALERHDALLRYRAPPPVTGPSIDETSGSDPRGL